MADNNRVGSSLLAQVQCEVCSDIQLISIAIVLSRGIRHVISSDK